MSTIRGHHQNFEVYLKCCLIHQRIKNHLKKSYVQKDRNFSFHLSRIICSILSKKTYYNENDILDLDIDNINEESFKLAIDMLILTIQSYEEENPDENIINISKSRKFVEKINSVLNEIIKK